MKNIPCDANMDARDGIKHLTMVQTLCTVYSAMLVSCAMLFFPPLRCCFFFVLFFFANAWTSIRFRHVDKSSSSRRRPLIWLYPAAIYSTHSSHDDTSLSLMNRSRSEKSHFAPQFVKQVGGLFKGIISSENQIESHLNPCSQSECLAQILCHRFRRMNQRNICSYKLACAAELAKELAYERLLLKVLEGWEVYQ